MLAPSSPLWGLLFLLSLQLFTAYPISTGLSQSDMDILKVILNKLEESVSERTEDQRVPAERDALDSVDTEEEAAGTRPQPGLSEAAIRAFLSVKSPKNVREDLPQRSSGCFGRRMDRIGSMSSLGCNTVGKYNPKKR
ncbi:natriuretic peptides B [Brachionichthys hirsutus]|uniref:natriuretic peptides B n=1 Tax=Brachionichthys hirsutus TaxID=412623 RepID=UPI003604BAFF